MSSKVCLKDYKCLSLNLKKNYGMMDDGSKGGVRLLKQVKNPNERLFMIVFIL
jgi:hypothetical protein